MFFEMADEEKDSSTEFTHSDALFVNESGECMRFCIRPCSEKVRIRKLIEHGGGILSAWAEASTMLHVDGDPCYSDGYYKSTFIDDCVKENSLMDLEDYEVENEKTKEQSKNLIIKKFPRLRNPYTEEEDSDILMYVAERPTFLNGNSIWKTMENSKVTDHPWQSMKSRFHHQLKDRLPEFIEIVRKQKSLNNGDSSFENCEDISCDEKDKTNDTEEDDEIKMPSTSKNQLVIVDSESDGGNWISVSQQTGSTTTSHEPNSSPPDHNEENTEDDDDASMVTAVEELNTPSSAKRKLFNFYKSKKPISQRLRNRIENVSNIQPSDNNADNGPMVTDVDEIRTPSSAKRKKLSFEINTVGESAKCISQRTRSQNKVKSPNQSHSSRCKKDIETNEDVDNNLVLINNNNANSVNGQTPQRKAKVGWRESDEGENDLDSEGELVDGQEISDADSGTEVHTDSSEVGEGQLDDEESDEEGSDTGRGTEEEDLNEDTLKKIMTDAEFYMERYGLTEAEVLCVYHKHKFKTDEVRTWFESF
ncbi:uncharacterized protein [Antedon mediterranea]|uniref:uncharacterized protein isoform X2 n=1 Tax=Antedon mediterranea TaxID=105859 RepID=UPI003AF956E8